ncbi:MAG: DUF423 domain-containing protein [Spiribacter sp.]|jgi:uncharacterized membrane protein YgdD (TMEM256/DUF423 family)|nr:DUF423 domain-containing protein [Spiribacter sp.]MDR9489765.1 DUF423 domain-containing protein [Spiribacter sp.]
MYPFLIGAGCLGLLSVAFGAFSEHALRPNVDAESFRYLMTAVRYNQVHAVTLLALAFGLAAPLAADTAWRVRFSAWLMLVGTILFSVSIYVAVLLDAMLITLITPIGGTVLMIAWASLIWAGWKARKG